MAKYGLWDTKSTCPTPHDVSPFYTSAAASADIDRRFSYIVNHGNSFMGNRAWKVRGEGVPCRQGSKLPVAFRVVPGRLFLLRRHALGRRPFLH